MNCPLVSMPTHSHKPTAPSLAPVAGGHAHGPASGPGNAALLEQLAAARESGSDVGSASGLRLLTAGDVAPAASPGPGVLRPRARPGSSGPRPVARPHAMGALGEHLDVVNDAMIGPRMPNQVSGAEFTEAMGLYDDIRTGNSNIAITPATGSSEAQASEFHGDVMSDVARLMSTDQGRGLLRELGTGEDGNDHKGIVGEGDHADTGWAQALEPEHATDGTGTHAGVFYDPNVIQDFRRGNTSPENDWAFMGSAETLFHELVHAKEIHEGTFSSEVVGDRASRPAEADVRADEYQAVGIGEFAGEYSENAFRRERSLVTGNSFAQRDHYGVALTADEIEHGHTTTIDLGKTPSHR